MYEFETLKTTLQDSIFTWDYFTDFEKVKANVKKIEKELNLLNYLIGKENIEEEFLSLVEEYPKVRKILPILIAIRDDKLSSTPIITDMQSLIPENKRYIFNNEIDENIKKELLLFFRETGLKDFFENKAQINSGTSTPHYWFYKLDYLLWKNNDLWKDLKYKFTKNDRFAYALIKTKFRLSRLNSIEHIHPQSKKEDWKDYSVDNFGNLALISNHMNSALIDKDNENKKLNKTLLFFRGYMR